MLFPLFAEDAPIISNGAVGIVGFVSVMIALIVRLEAVWKTVNDIWMKWRTIKTTEDSVVVTELKTQLSEIKGECVDLRASLNYYVQQQTADLVEQEKLWGYIIPLYDYAQRVASEVTRLGGSVLPPPPLPKRHERKHPDDSFFQRTRATTARLAKEADSVMQAPVPPPSASGSGAT